MAYSPHVWPLVLASLFCTGAGIYARRYPDVPASRPFVTMMWLGAAWAGIYALNISVVHLPLRVFLSTCIYVPTRLIPPVSLVLAVRYTGRERFLTRRNLVALFFLPVLAIFASLSSPYHRLFRYGFRLETGGPVSVLHYSGGPIYWLTTVYGTALVLASLALLARSLGDRALRVRNTLLLIAGLLVPVVFDILFSAGITPIRGYSFAPASLTITAMAYLWALLRNRLFGISSIARTTVVDNIEDLVIVFDTRGQISDFNVAAEAVCGLDPKRSIGATSDSLGGPWASFFRGCSLTSACKEEASIVVDGAERFYDLTISPIEDYRKRFVGRLFVLHDVTQRREAEREIQRLLDEKELLLREVHHRIKNNMSVIASILSLQAETLVDSQASAALRNARNRVVSMMVLYDRLYRSSGEGLISIHDYLSPLLDRIMHSVGDEATVELRKEIQDFSVSSRNLLPIGIIANELMTNAMKHAFVGRAHGTVTVSTNLGDGRAYLEIADDGIGIGDSEDGASVGFGLQLVETLIEHIGGRLEVQRKPSARFVLEFDPGLDGERPSP